MATVRRATRADMPDILELVRELATFEKLTPPDGAAYARLLRDLGTRFDAWVALEEGRAVGYAIAYETYSSFQAKPVLWLEDVYVTPNMRRKGVGHLLLAEVAKEAQQRGCARVAWAVLDWNTDAMRMYDALGASKKPWVWYELAGDAMAKVAGGPSA
ncbi:MAG TPA: GNAT family N-acetyltransferase [Candidatus Thermoplasmatota archaeon]|nr:GNAT family N-acetyltransferase [Candidatus Thermoplasmatota archaeon]